MPDMYAINPRRPDHFYDEPETVYCIRHGDELPCPICAKEDQ